MDDLISRQAAIDAIVNTPSDIQNENIPLVNQYDGATFRQIEILGILESLPSAERRGRWEDVEHAPNDLLYATCSVCGKRQTVEAVNYCGNCGAKMDDNWEEPAINPCRGCEDYDGRRGCISKGGCGAKMEATE